MPLDTVTGDSSSPIYPHSADTIVKHFTEYGKRYYIYRNRSILLLGSDSMVKMINDTRICTKSLLTHYRAILNSFIVFVDDESLDDPNNTYLYLSAVIECLNLQDVTRDSVELLECLVSLRSLAFVIMENLESLPTRH